MKERFLSVFGGDWSKPLTKHGRRDPSMNSWRTCALMAALASAMLILCVREYWLLSSDELQQVSLMLRDVEYQKDTAAADGLHLHGSRAEHYIVQDAFITDEQVDSILEKEHWGRTAEILVGEKTGVREIIVDGQCWLSLEDTSSKVREEKLTALTVSVFVFAAALIFALRTAALLMEGEMRRNRIR